MITKVPATTIAFFKARLASSGRAGLSNATLGCSFHGMKLESAVFELVIWCGVFVLSCHTIHSERSLLSDTNLIGKVLIETRSKNFRLGQKLKISNLLQVQGSVALPGCQHFKIGKSVAPVGPHMGTPELSEDSLCNAKRQLKECGEVYSRKRDRVGEKSKEWISHKPASSQINGNGRYVETAKAFKRQRKLAATYGWWRSWLHRL